MASTVVTQSEAETEAVGRDLAQRLHAGAIVLLSGELGAGKTAFVRGLAAGLDAEPAEVSSPTFTLVQEYRGGRVPLYHADLYRLRPTEVDDLGLAELSEAGVLAIEWPDRLPRPYAEGVQVHIEYLDDTQRKISIE